ncbi:MAG: hypothetical protein ACYTXA_16320 [Nostoc sp.]
MKKSVFPNKNNFKSVYNTGILAQSPTQSQSQHYKRLAQAINKRELTSSLEILAESQIEDDLAIFMLALLQEVAA